MRLRTTKGMNARQIVRFLLSDWPGDCVLLPLDFSRLPLPSGEGPWLEHVGLYAFARGTLEALTLLHPTALEKAERLEQLRWLEHGWRISVGRTSHSTYAVDTLDDLNALEARIARGEVD